MPSQTVILRFGSVTGKCTVSVNGKTAARHEGAALPFEIDITELLCEGENRLSVVSDNTLDPWTIPPAVLSTGYEGRMGFMNSYPAVTYDFFPYSGIHRSVTLSVVPKLRIEDITVTTALCSDGSADVHYKIRTTDHCPYAQICTDGQIQNVLFNDMSAEGTIKVKNPALWDICKPNLYKLDVKIYDKNDKLIDEYSLQYGIREIKTDNCHLYLNGHEIFLKGFGKHEDFPIIGKGFFAPGAIKDFELMKKLGANSFRTSHYPYDEQMLTLADELGILVISETPMVGFNERMFCDDILERAKGLIHELIDRDKNHPCVIAWSLANEPIVSIPEGEHFFREMADTARACDSTRPITYAAHMEPEDNLGAKYYDFICINKYYGWYIAPGMIDETLSELEKELDRFYDALHIPVMVTEFGADAIAGMHTAPPLMFSEEYQSDMLQKQYKLIRSKPYIIGTHIWAFADFRTAQSISRIIDNRKGVFTRTREPKLAAHTVEKMWTDSPSL